MYRKGRSYNPKPQIPGGLSVNSWLIEPSTLCEVPGIFDMGVVNMVVPNLDVEYGNSTYGLTSNLSYYIINLLKK